MLIFFDSQNNPFAGVSPRLFNRKMKELDEGLAEFGLKAVGAVKDGIRVDTRQCPSSLALQQYLAAVGAITVTAEPSDMKVLCDNHMSPEALGVIRNWPAERFTDLLPEELTPAVRQTFWDSYTGEAPDENDEFGAVMIKQIEDDLAAVGLAVPKSTNALEANLVTDSSISDERYHNYTETRRTAFDLEPSDFGA